MSRDYHRSLRFPGRLAKTIHDRLEENETFSDWVFEACSERLRHASESNKAKFRELQVYGSKTGDGHESAVDRRFDQLLHRRGFATDMAGGGGGELDGDLATVAKVVLTEVQYRRLLPHLQEGLTMEQIAHQEGVAKQAVHTSIRTAKARLVDSKKFRDALVDRAAQTSFEDGVPLVKGHVFLDGTISFERMFEMVAGARPMSADVASCGRLHPTLGRAMRPILTKSQYRRIEMVYARGMSIRQIAEAEDRGKTSIHQSVTEARKRLRSSIPVLRALCQTYTEQSGVEIDADAMVLALTSHSKHERRTEKLRADL